MNLKLLKPSTQPLSIISYVVSVIPTIVHNFYTTHYLKIPYPHYLLYYQPIETLIGSVIGLFVVVTMFYLGKFHDYHNEQIKYSSELIGVMDKLKIRLKINADESKKAELAKWNEHYKSIREIDKAYFSLPRTTLIPFIVYVFQFGLFYFDSIRNVQNPILGNFVDLLVFISVGIAQFLLSWIWDEKNMSHIKSLFQDISDLTLKIKSILYEMEIMDKLPTSSKPEHPLVNTDNKPPQN